jgi:hypothetical protein
MPHVRIHKLNRIARLDLEHLGVGRVVHVAAATTNRIGRIRVVSRIRDAAIRTFLVGIRVDGLVKGVGDISDGNRQERVFRIDERQKKCR